MTEKIILVIVSLYVSRYMAIIIHEMGHYLFAKNIGITVRVFSIGSGPALIVFNRFGTKWVFNLVPSGGFINVKCPSSVNGDSDCVITDFLEFYPENKMMSMIAAGPCFSLLFGLLFLGFLINGFESLFIITWILIGDFLVSSYPGRESDGHQILKIVRHRTSI